jgi:hypothetical protein
MRNYSRGRPIVPPRAAGSARRILLLSRGGVSYVTTRAGKGPAGGRLAFFLALAIASAFFLPLIIYNRGYFLFLGDFNVQQIPFYRLAHEAVRNGEIFWNWHTDLGANFIGSYSFYLLFSPFFWLTLPFPTEFVPHLMGPLLILKTACAALTGYLYIKRFVKDRAWTVVGSLLYAFSGYMTFNIFFNHFHEPVVFFPLLLVSLEELVENNRRGFFAAMVAVNCLVNYWFFIGEVLFVILYVAVRLATGGWNCSLGRFCAIALESVLGVLVAAAGLLPSVLALMGNPRTGADSLLTGWLMWIYGFNQRLPAIIQSFFFPPELPSRPNFFPEMGAKWASLSAWLPLFSAVGVIAFCRARKRDFIKRMIILSMILALIPIGNAAFVLFSQSYYARWFYMPVLLMCVATAAALEERHAPAMAEGLRSGWRWTAGFVLIISAAVAFSPVRGTEGEITFGLYDNAAGFWLIVCCAVLCLILSALLLFVLGDHPRFYPITCAMLSALIVVFSLGYLSSGKNSRQNDDWFIQVALGKGQQLELPDDVFARSDVYEGMDNLGMFWGLPNIQAFHSIVPASIMEFYPAVGIKRDVSSKPPTDYLALRPLLSVRWLFVGEQNEKQPPMDGVSLYDTQLGYNIYENDLFLPMGFAYDTALSHELLKTIGGEPKTRYMLHSLVLEDDALIRNSDIIDEDADIDYDVLPPEGLEGSVAARRSMSADSFAVDRLGFSATSNLDRERLMFFSVPHDKGWSAAVNGQPVVIEKANIGFMAVRVPAGEAAIRFDYRTPGLFLGLRISALGAAALLLYLLIARMVGGRRRRPIPPPQQPQPPARVSLEEYLEALDELPPAPPEDSGQKEENP